MTWANVDDLFPEHPKVIKAGGDAAWLYICALCFTNRNLTEGRIPKAVVPRLSDRKAPMRLAKRLVDVGLWHDEGDAFVIHDWDKYNEGAEKVKARKEQARNAARAKWSKHAQSNANSTAPSTAHAHAPPRDEQCDEHALSSPSAYAGAMPSHSSPTDVDRSSSSNTVVGPEPAEEEDPVRKVGLLVAQLRLERRMAKTHLEPITNRSAWIASTAAEVLQSSGDNIPALLAQGQTVEQIVDLFEPPDRPPEQPPAPSREHVPSPYDQVWDEQKGEWKTVRVSA